MDVYVCIYMYVRMYVYGYIYICMYLHIHFWKYERYVLCPDHVIPGGWGDGGWGGGTEGGLEGAWGVRLRVGNGGTPKRYAQNNIVINAAFHHIKMDDTASSECIHSM